MTATLSKTQFVLGVQKALQTEGYLSKDHEGYGLWDAVTGKAYSSFLSDLGVTGAFLHIQPEHIGQLAFELQEVVLKALGLEVPEPVVEAVEVVEAEVSETVVVPEVKEIVDHIEERTGGQQDGDEGEQHQDTGAFGAAAVAESAAVQPTE
jgi:hypothetical protein